MTRGQHTFEEIMSQPSVWGHALTHFADNQAIIEAFFADNPFDEILVTGCGSTHYLAMVGARLIQQQSGISARAYPASEFVLYPDSTLNLKRRYLLIAVSRSGTTTETLRAVEMFREKTNGKVLTITCYSTSPLAQQADLTLAIDEAQEQSVAQTRSYSSMCVTLQQLAGWLGRQNTEASQSLPQHCRKLFDNYAEMAQALGENPNLKKFFFLGSDALYGISAEAMLKMKEMSLSYSEAYHTLEFRHGPMSMVDDESLVVGLISPDSEQHERDVLAEMQQKGATVLAIGQGDYDFEHSIRIPSDLPQWATPVLYLPMLQLMGYHRSLFNRQDPDNPHNLTSVISLDNI